MDDLPDLVSTTSNEMQSEAAEPSNDIEFGSDIEDDIEHITDENVEDFVGKLVTKCVLCDNEFSSPECALEHMSEAHAVNIINICSTHSLDQVGYIKLINYMRHNSHFSEAHKFSDPNFEMNNILTDDYMIPHTVDDPLLRFDVQYKLDEFEDQNPQKEERMDISLKNEVSELKEIVAMQNKVIARLRDQMLQETEVVKREFVSDPSHDNDAGYFESYASYEIHQEMLQDEVRTTGYRDAIIYNKPTFNGSRVLDVGCGTGILSMFCASAGAKSVDAVDLANVAYDAMEIVKSNKLDHIINVKHGKLEDQNFPYKFDIIVSEWMGYFLLFEGMLDSVLYARDHFLKPGGLMLPNRCTMLIMAIDDEKLYHSKQTFWNNVYGYDMSCIGKKYIKLAATEVISNSSVATSTAQVAEFDINSCSVVDTNFTSSFTLIPIRDTELLALAGYFDTFFDLKNKESFSTGPHATPTHWKQTVFYLPKPIVVKQGEEIEGSITVKRMSTYVRGLDVSFKIADQTLEYTVY